MAYIAMAYTVMDTSPSANPERGQIKSSLGWSMDASLAALYRLYLGITDGAPFARAWARQHSKCLPRRGGRFEYRHAHTRATGMPSAMPI